MAQYTQLLMQQRGVFDRFLAGDDENAHLSRYKSSDFQIVQTNYSRRIFESNFIFNAYIMQVIILFCIDALYPIVIHIFPN